MKVEHSYSQDFVDQAKCKEAALNHIANGATVVFQVAGQCGLGVRQAAKEKGVFGSAWTPTRATSETTS